MTYLPHPTSSNLPPPTIHSLLYALCAVPNTPPANEVALLDKACKKLYAPGTFYFNDANWGADLGIGYTAVSGVSGLQSIRVQGLGFRTWAPVGVWG